MSTESSKLLNETKLSPKKTINDEDFDNISDNRDLNVKVAHSDP